MPNSDISSRDPQTRLRGVVGIGASAGGLEALRTFFENMPSNSGLTFVVVQHLAPEHKSLMAEILAKHTKMPVLEAEDGVVIEPDIVYLLPPARVMTIAAGRLHLVTKELNSGLSLPIDLFLESLAADQGERAIAVILSGTGSDGSRGIRAIKEARGRVLVQEPQSSAFDGMPRSAIASGLVDDVVPAEMLADSIIALSRAPRPALPHFMIDPEDPGVQEVVSALNLHTDVDFALYRRSTVARRIERRMHQIGRTGLADYARYVRENPSEAQFLSQDLLIGVTRFFRDEGAFEALAEKVIPDIVAKAQDQEPIRIWVCGCATGEEAYTVAILFAEHMRKNGRNLDLKIFATDIDHDGIEAASQGAFDEEQMAAVPDELRQRYFLPLGRKSAIVPPIRNMVVFARHNVFKDPPFTRVHLITCRNLLIYLEPILQRKVLTRFHFALRAGGYLFQGSSETLGDLASGFTVVDAKHRIYRVVQDSQHLPADLLDHGAPVRVTAPMRRFTRPAPVDNNSAVDLAISQLMADFTPASLLINDAHEIVHIFGNGSRYLQMASGATTLGLMKLLVPALRGVVGSAVHRAMRTGNQVQCRPVQMELEDGPVAVLPVIRPFVDRNGRPHCMIVLGSIRSEGHGPGEAEETPDERIQSLEFDLRISQENLQASNEQLEQSNEELQTANEELVTSNEELQSTNEELQSVNEELYSLNSEYEAKIEELSRATDDLDNLLQAIDLPVLYLDSNLIIRRFTPALSTFFHIMPRDIGRSIAHLALTLEYPEFLDDLRNTLTAGTRSGREVRTSYGQWVLVTLLPYVSTLPRGQAAEPTARGVIVTVFDITEIKSAQNHLQAVLDSLPASVVVVDARGAVTSANSAWVRLAGVSAQSLVGRDYLRLCRELGELSQETCIDMQEGMQEVRRERKESFWLRVPWKSGELLVHVAALQGTGGSLVVTHLPVTTGFDPQGHLRSDGGRDGR